MNNEHRIPEPHRTFLIKLLLKYLGKKRYAHHYRDYKDIKCGASNDRLLEHLYLGEYGFNIRN